MMPIKKNPQPQGNLPIVLSYKNMTSNQNELPDHAHDWCELIYIHEGTATFFIDDIFLKLEEKSLVIVPPNVIHRTILNTKEHITSTVIYFSPAISTTMYNENVQMILNELFVQSKKKKNFVHRFSKEKTNILEQFFDNINFETKNMHDFWEEAVFTKIISFMIQLHRWTYNNTKTHHSIPPDLIWIKKAFEYIDLNLHSQIHLSDLARIAYVSTEHFSRKFKNTVGMTVSDYIIKKRINKAKELLKETDLNVQTVAENTGFTSLPYFYRTFKKETGKTPSSYRKDLLDQYQII